MGMVYGYCRVSTPKQKIDRQIDNIRKHYPDAVIYQDEWTGRTMARKGWESLMRVVKENPECTIVFDEVSRMSRNAAEGFDTYMQLMNQGTELVFLKEPYINTSVYRKAQNDSIPKTGNDVADIYVDATNRLLKLLAKKQIEAAFQSAQHEVDYLSQRTKEGLKARKLRGVTLGRKNGVRVVTAKERRCKPEIRRLAKDFDGNNTDREVMKILGIDKNTYYKYKRKIIAEITES